MKLAIRNRTEFMKIQVDEDIAPSHIAVKLQIDLPDALDFDYLTISLFHPDGSMVKQGSAEQAGRANRIVTFDSDGVAFDTSAFVEKSAKGTLTVRIDDDDGPELGVIKYLTLSYN